MPHPLGEIAAWIFVGLFVFWLIGGFIALRWVLRMWDEGSDE